MADKRNEVREAPEQCATDAEEEACSPSEPPVPITPREPLLDQTTQLLGQWARQLIERWRRRHDERRASS